MEGEVLPREIGSDRGTVSPVLSIVTPAYNESQNLPVFHQRLCEALDGVEVTWQWVIVDDHSRDATFDCAKALAAKDPRVMALRFSRNFGSHRAIVCGLRHATGRCVAAMASDLQDPPETLPRLLEKWQEGAHVVWAARARRAGEKPTGLAFSRLYYWIMRKLVGLGDMPAEGADFFLLDRRAVRALLQFPETNTSVFALINWMGFRQTTIQYDKQARQAGRSGWTLEKKIKLLVDSITSFSYFPIRVLSCLGFGVAVAGFIYAGVVIRNALAGLSPYGWPSLMVVILVLSGTQMLMMGVLGEYLWRAFEESRRRPAYLIEDMTPEPVGP